MFQTSYGMDTKRPSSGNVYHYLYVSVPQKGIIPNIRLRPFKRNICRLRHVVDSISVYLDNSLGSDYAPAQSNYNSQKGMAIYFIHSIAYASLRPSRAVLWDTVRAGAGYYVRLII